MEKEFLDMNTDFHDFTDPENMLDYEIGFRQGLVRAFALMNTTEMKSGYARLIRDMKKNVSEARDRQTQFLLDWLNEEY
jgi:hypothetical protein